MMEMHLQNVKLCEIMLVWLEQCFMPKTVRNMIKDADVQYIITCIQRFECDKSNQNYFV